MTRLITHLTNIRYLINFKGTHGFLLIKNKRAFFFTDFRYRGIAEELMQSKMRLPFKFIELDEAFTKKFKQSLGQSKKLEFESNHMTLDELKSWKKRFKGIQFVPTKNPIEAQRLIKDKEEIKAMKESQRINEETLKRVKKMFKKGVTELELAWQIKAIGHDLGAEDISFEPIVAFGAHSAIPHHHNTSTKLKMTDVVLIDMGMKIKGYCSDMTRTFLPKNPSAEQVNVYQKVLRAQNLAIEAVKPGVACRKLDEIARKSMGSDAAHFGHSLGHGIGLDVHEAPNLNGHSSDRLKKGMVITVEPGIYLPGKFGVRIEDCGLVTEKDYENFMGMEK